jgi:antitoxin (DNA-binding transcriptional repressor) of toxin-antitoxin stability system
VKRSAHARGPEVLTVTEAARRFSEVVGRVAFKGERFTLTKGGQAVAQLGPVTGPDFSTGAALAEVWRQHRRMSRTEANALARDIAGARKSVGRVPKTAAWD